MDDDDQDDEPRYIYGGKITETQQRYLMHLAREGHKGRAAEATGIHPATAWRWKRGTDTQEPAPDYLAALAIAEDLSDDRIEDEVRRRAMEGEPRYRFSGATPVRHPENCECGHNVREHAKPPEDDDKGPRPCRAFGCDCDRFYGEPYVEHERSDRLLGKLIEAKKPREYATRRVEYTRQIDWDRLPDHLVARIARGEDVNAVLASAADEGERYLLKSGAELGGPGAGGAGEAEHDEGDGEDGDEGDGWEGWGLDD
jgi:hypothetical protein